MLGHDRRLSASASAFGDVGIRARGFANGHQLGIRENIPLTLLATRNRDPNKGRRTPDEKSRRRNRQRSVRSVNFELDGLINATTIPR